MDMHTVESDPTCYAVSPLRIIICMQTYNIKTDNNNNNNNKTQIKQNRNEKLSWNPDSMTTLGQSSILVSHYVGPTL